MVRFALKDPCKIHVSDWLDTYMCCSLRWKYSRKDTRTHNSKPIVHNRPEVEELSRAKDGDALQVKSSEAWCQALANHVA